MKGLLVFGQGSLTCHERSDVKIMIIFLAICIVLMADGSLTGRGTDSCLTIAPKSRRCLKVAGTSYLPTVGDKNQRSGTN